MKIKEAMSPEEELRRSDMVLLEIQDQPQSIQVFVTLFVQKSVSPVMHVHMATFLFLFTRDAAMSSALPFCCHDFVRQLCSAVTQLQFVDTLLERLKDYVPELVSLFKNCEEEGTLGSEVCAFVLAIVDRIEYIHSENPPTQDPKPLPGTYDPPSGCAYYFTASGAQVRKLPVHSITGKEPKTVEAPCNKTYPLVSRGVYGYLFLWFCPLHGHCYGFHLIKGGEGRKDPFASLWKFLPNPPKEVFYDFACGMSEYCLNREPNYFRETRFFHDIFHSFPHVCGPNFRSVRLSSLDGVNTEICEQWNSFLQCIKYTASHLSQSHMVFFMQFMIFLQNKRKTHRFQNQARIAMEGWM